MSIILEEKSIAARNRVISGIVSPFFIDRNKIEVRSVGASQFYHLAVLEKGQKPTSYNDPADVRVKTRLNRVYLNYHERWKLQAEENSYVLIRAYLHIHVVRRETQTDEQILCLHCDPDLSAGDGNYKYKRGPHLHIGGCNPDIVHGHISIVVNDKKLGGENIEEITNSMKMGALMIYNEIYHYYEKI